MINKKLLALVLFFSCCTSAFANEDGGVYVGGGFSSLDEGGESCSSCDTDGLVLEAGLQFNKYFDVDAKYAQTSSGSYNLDMVYLGGNFGSDFGTKIVRVYGKAGYAHTSVDFPGYYGIRGGRSESNIAYGAGVRFTFGQRSGLYIKLESLRTELKDDSIRATFVSVGYLF